MMDVVPWPPLASPYHSFTNSLGSTIAGVSDLSLQQLVILGGDLDSKKIF